MGLTREKCHQLTIERLTSDFDSYKILQCAKDCGPCKRSHNHTPMPVFAPAQAIFKDSVLIFLNYLEGRIKPTMQKHANKIIIPIFLIMKDTLDIHSSRNRLKVFTWGPIKVDNVHLNNDTASIMIR